MSEKPSQFEPINPLDLSDEEQDAYFDRLNEAQYRDDGQTPEEYIGSKDLLRLIRKRAIGVGVITRIWQTDLPEFHCLTHRGLIPFTPGRGMYEDRTRILEHPYERLDQNLMGKPYRWSIEGYELISNSDIDKLVNPSS